MIIYLSGPGCMELNVTPNIWNLNLKLVALINLNSLELLVWNINSLEFEPEIVSFYENPSITGRMERNDWMARSGNWNLTFLNWLIRMLLFFFEPCNNNCTNKKNTSKKIHWPFHRCSSSWWCWSLGCRPPHWGPWCPWSSSCSCTLPVPPWQRLCQLKKYLA